MSSTPTVIKFCGSKLKTKASELWFLGGVALSGYKTQGSSPSGYLHD